MAIDIYRNARHILPMSGTLHDSFCHCQQKMLDRFSVILPGLRLAAGEMMPARKASFTSVARGWARKGE
jgi:hypothetical protein